MFTKGNIILIAIIGLCAGHVFSQEKLVKAGAPWPEITEAMGAGDSGSLAEYFSTMVDLGLPGKDDTYSKSQGEIIMKDFFKKCPPDTFEVMKQGEINKSTHFAIGNYLTGDINYQVSIHLQYEGGKYLISKIKFEKKDFSPQSYDELR